MDARPSLARREGGPRFDWPWGRDRPAPGRSRGVRVAALGLVAAASMVLTGCGGGDEGEASSQPDALPTGEQPTPAAAPPAGPRPMIAPREGQPPAELRITDIEEGYGPELRSGDVVSMQYVGGLWPDGTEFDASWDRGQPFTFVLGAGQVIQGWDEGIVGMKLGGRRELVIPPDLAYGKAGSGAIPPDATLIFVVDAVGQVAATPAEEEE